MKWSEASGSSAIGPFRGCPIPVSRPAVMAEQSSWTISATASRFFRAEWAPLSNATLTIGSTFPTGLLLNPARHVGVYGLTLIGATFGCLLYRIYCYRCEGKNPWRAVTVPLLLVAVVLLGLSRRKRRR